jgi:LmbE family N-acetylglucosaminyl deacetylase
MKVLFSGGGGKIETAPAPLKTPVSDVAHVPKRAVFALVRTPLCLSISLRSHECERGTQGACATRRLHRFGKTLLVLAAIVLVRGEDRLKVLAVVAHPDDEYAFAATTYRIARELGGVVDLIVISNGEAGYRYSVLAEQVYGLRLTDETVGRANLPEIRKQESLAAGRILGIRQHHFLDQKDAAFTLNVEEAASAWDKPAVRGFIAKLLREEGYGFVFTLLPAAATHGEHKAATILALEAVQSLPEGQRPVVFGVEAGVGHQTEGFVELGGYPVTRAGTDIHEFQRLRAFGFHDALNYEIIANWVIAAYKSQGLFQMDAGRHDLERFWRFEVSGGHSEEAAQRLFDRVQPRPAKVGQQAAGSRP